MFTNECKNLQTFVFSSEIDKSWRILDFFSKTVRWKETPVHFFKNLFSKIIQNREVRFKKKDNPFKKITMPCM